jgi:RNA polymerase sigma factor (sigma-70 family)
MATEDRSAVTRYLRRMIGPAGGAGLTDAQLLERFVCRRDQAAFEVLVWRHGPMVLGVCRRVLRHEQDAEDAFQAAFLVLVRKAASIGARQAVGSWLYRVAYRVAVRAKVLAQKRAARQTQLDDAPAARPAADPAWSDLRPVLDEEVSRLPEKYRAPFVLCYLGGKTNEEAARDLGCPKGTVLSRLAWARQRLRARLTRRGLGLSAGLVTAASAPDLAAAVPAALVDSTRRAALLVAAGQQVAGVVAGQVTALSKGVLQTMFWNKILIAASCVLAACALAVGGALTRSTLGARETTGPPAGQPEAKQDKAGKPDKPPDRTEAPKPKEKTYSFEIRDKPWPQVFEWYSDISGLPFVGTERPTGTVQFIAPKQRQYTLEEITDHLNELLLAKNYLLVRREASFTVLLADEKIDATLLPRVRLDDLAKRGKTELVTVVLPLTHLYAQDIGPEVKKMMGPFGAVVILEKANRLILQDTAGNLRRIHELVKEVEAKEAEKNRDSKSRP